VVKDMEYISIIIHNQDVGSILILILALLLGSFFGLMIFPAVMSTGGFNEDTKTSAKSVSFLLFVVPLVLIYFTISLANVVVQSRLGIFEEIKQLSAKNEKSIVFEMKDEIDKEKINNNVLFLNSKGYSAIIENNKIIASFEPRIIEQNKKEFRNILIGACIVFWLFLVYLSYSDRKRKND
jgi:hypothetical protein